MAFVVDQHAGCTFAGSEAFGEFERELAVGSRVARLEVILLAELSQYFLAAAQHARQAAADLQPIPAELVFRVAEEAVEAHRVVNFRRVLIEDFGDLLDRFERHAPQRVLHMMQRRQRHRPLRRILR